jgi:enolase
LRDGAKRYGGNGVLRAVANARHVLGPAVEGLDASDQRTIDETLISTDGTPDLSRLGANAVLAISVATAIASAEARGVPLYRYLANSLGVEPLLPLPMVNVLSGGAHAGGCLDVQDFLVVPLGATSFAEAIEWAAAVREATRREATAMGYSADLAADEGGLGLALKRNRAALDLLCAGIEAAGLRPGTDAGIAIDVAASQLATPPGTCSGPRVASSMPPSLSMSLPAGVPSTRSSRSRIPSGRTIGPDGSSPPAASPGRYSS